MDPSKFTGRPFVRDLGPSPFNLLRTHNLQPKDFGRAYMQIPESLGVISEDLKDHCETNAKHLRDLELRFPPLSLNEASVSEETFSPDDLAALPHSPAATKIKPTPKIKRAPPPRQLLSWDGNDLGISPFEGRRRPQAVMDSSSKFSSGRPTTGLPPPPGPKPALASQTSPWSTNLLTEQLNRVVATQQTHQSVDRRSTSTTNAAPFRVRRRSRPQPFLQTHLGRVPAEVREVIWKYVLIAPTEHVLVKFATDESNSSSSEDGSSSDLVASGITFPGTEWLVSSTFPGFNLLRTCTFIYKEGHNIFFSSNSFHLTSGSDLLSFLKSIGSQGRTELRSLRLGGLIGTKIDTEEELDEMFPRDQPELAERRVFWASTPHPYVYEDTDKAAVILRSCEHLTQLFLEIKVGDECYATSFLGEAQEHFPDTPWVRLKKIEFVDDFHWIIRPVRPGEPCGSGFMGTAESARPSTTSWGINLWGNERVVEVEIVRDPNAPNLRPKKDADGRYRWYIYSDSDDETLSDIESDESFDISDEE